MKVVDHKTEFYEVEEVKGKRVANGKKEYLIKWKGFGEDECTWEPISNLDACAKMITKYEKENVMAEEKVASRSPKPDRKKAKSNKDDVAPEIHANKMAVAGESKKQMQKSSQMDEEKIESKYDVLKRTSIDSEIVFKVFDQVSKKELFVSRKDLLKEDPVALCMFYEKHIVS